MSTTDSTTRSARKAAAAARTGAPEWLDDCIAGDAKARRAFQDELGPSIYGFPTKIYGVDEAQAADFYVYVFERDRIFHRLRTFEGRNRIQFRTFLSFYVLKALFVEWQRTHKEIRTVSLATPLGGGDDEGGTLEDVLPDPASAAPAPAAAGPEATLLVAGLEPEERLDLKLLSLVEQDLTPEDVRLLARLSGRSVRDTPAAVAEVQDGLRAKDAKATQLRDELDSTWGWIHVRSQDLQETRESLRLLGPVDSERRRRLEERRVELETALAKRTRQRERLVREIEAYKVTTPYKDIARLRGQAVGTVCSRIFRLRKRLLEAFGEVAEVEAS